MSRPFLIGLFTTIIALLIASGCSISYAVRRKAERDAIQTTHKKEDIQVTIIEGKRREEIAAQLAAAGITPYNDFLAASQNFEGQLFPDTYRFFPNVSPTDVVNILHQNFLSRTQTLSHEQLPAGLTSFDDAVKLASIVEREARTDSERAIVAKVYLNRIQAGMTLDADPTVQYAKDSLAYQASPTPQTFTFWAQITQADYRGVASPFNTYEHAGLPPTPIANPGLASLNAVFTPASHDYLYFFYRNNQIYLSHTLQEQEQKLAQP